MKLIKIYLSACFIFSSFAVNAQKDDSKLKLYYKDTLFNFAGFKVEVVKSIATEKYFKTSVIITNTSDNFIRVNPEQIFGNIPSQKAKFSPDLKKAVVIPPKYSKVVIVKFIGADYKVPEMEITFTSLDMTDKVLKEYEIPDMNVYSNDSIEIGPLKWIILDKSNEREQKAKKDFRLVTKLTYSGTNFLGISYNDFVLKTKDGGNYINVNKKSGFLVTTDKFYYDNSKKFEKQTLVFPVSADKITENNAPKINFKNVFKEYSFQKIEGFKIKLRLGTEEDFKGGDKKTKDIEGME